MTCRGVDGGGSEREHVEVVDTVVEGPSCCYC